jgi:hypothetical protein
MYLIQVQEGRRYLLQAARAYGCTYSRYRREEGTYHCQPGSMDVPTPSIGGMEVPPTAGS